MYGFELKDTQRNINNKKEHNKYGNNDNMDGKQTTEGRK